MSRRNRPYLPGTCFHLTVRTLRRERWIKDPGMPEFLVHAVARAQQGSDAELIAFAIMSNHIHLIVRQMNAPLARLMQPLDRIIALRLQRCFKRKGTMIERRYFARPCTSARHLRNWILYTHLNPRRAKVCSLPGEYPWTSHYAYCSTLGREPRPGWPRLHVCAELFARSDCNDLDSLCADYNAFVERRMDIDDATEDVPRPLMLRAAAGDDFFGRTFITPAQLPARQRPPVDLRDLVRLTLKGVNPTLTIDQLRWKSNAAALVALRRTVIQRAIFAGFRTSEIARFLGVSDSCVSKVATVMFREQWLSALQPGHS